MTPVTFMLGATGLTVLAQLARPGELSGLGISRTVVGGFLATTGVLVLGQLGSADVANGIAALVFVTAAFVHGATLSTLTLDYLNRS